LPEIDKQILQFGETEKIFEQSLNRADQTALVFYEGLPFANRMLL